MKLEIDLNELRNEDGTFKPGANEAVETLTGRSLYSFINDNPGALDSVTVNGQPVTNKSQLKDVQKRASFFSEVRKKGGSPKKEYDQLPD